MLYLAALPFIIVASYFLTLRVRQNLLRRAQLDVPNDRSMHKEPVPRGGGIAVMAVIYTGMTLVLCAQKNIAPQCWLMMAAFLLIFVSWCDDRKKGGIGVGLRLGSHLLAAYLASLALPPETMLFEGLVPFWLDRALMILGWAWFMNLYNFMDGIDGITCVESIVVASGVALLLLVLNIGDMPTYALITLIVGACLGFLLLNWHPAKIFLGDVGSVPLGLLIGYLLLLLVAGHHPFSALILPLYYLADSGITITKRALHGEKIWKPHRQHFYQRAAQAIGRHDTVVRWIRRADLTLIWAALIALAAPWAGLGLAFVIVAFLLFKLHKVSIV